MKKMCRRGCGHRVGQGDVHKLGNCPPSRNRDVFGNAKAFGHGQHRLVAKRNKLYEDPVAEAMKAKGRKFRAGAESGIHKVAASSKETA